MKYLSSKQAIEDLANFINFIKNKYNLTDQNKWISFGGSYPGGLSAMIRAKYPNLIHASFSSSAPMFFKTDFNGYMEVLGKSLKSYSVSCYDEISNAYKQIESLINTTEGRSKIRSTFK